MHFDSTNAHILIKQNSFTVFTRFQERGYFGLNFRDTVHILLILASKSMELPRSFD